MKQKKRKYGSFFVQRIIPCILVASAFGAFGTWSLHYVSEDWAADEERTTMNVLETALQNGKGENDFNAQFIFSPVVNSSLVSQAALIYNTETGECWDSRPRVGIFVRYRGEKDENGKSKVQKYLLNDEALVSRIWELIDADIFKQLQPECLDIYVKDDTFLPGKVIQTKWAGEEPVQVGEPIDMTPADTTGWTHIVANETNSITVSEGDLILNTFAFGTEPENERLLNNVREYADNHLSEWGVQNGKTGNIERNMRSYVSGWKKDDTFRWDNITVNGQKWHIYLYSHLNFYSEWKILLLGGWSFLVAVALIIAAVWARAVYHKYCKEYELTEYRRKLTGSLAHDLKTPLTAISGYAENLMSQVHTEKRTYYVTAILENTKYMDRIIADVLELSKLEQAERPECTECDWMQLVQEAFVPYEDMLNARDISVQFSGACKRKANAQMMKQAFGNLAANAAKYCAEGGCIDVTGTEKGLRIVNDTNGEIADAAALTAAFAKGNKARGSNTGSGLGLTIVQNIAELHHYKFNVSAEHNKFTVEILAEK